MGVCVLLVRELRLLVSNGRSFLSELQPKRVVWVTVKVEARARVRLSSDLEFEGGLRFMVSVCVISRVVCVSVERVSGLCLCRVYVEVWMHGCQE